MVHPLQTLADDLVRDGRPSFQWMVEHVGAEPFANVVERLWREPATGAHVAYAYAVGKLAGSNEHIVARWAVREHRQQEPHASEEEHPYWRTCHCCVNVFRNHFVAAPLPSLP